MNVSIIPWLHSKRGAFRANPIGSPGHLPWVGHCCHNLSHRLGDCRRSERLRRIRRPHERGVRLEPVDDRAGGRPRLAGERPRSTPSWARLFDTLGGRKVLLASLATFGVTTVLLATTFHILFLILVFRVIMSIAWSGTSLTTTSALLSRWSQRKRATVLSLSTAGASAGGLLLVPLGMYVLQQTDWRMTWVALGVLILVVALPLAVFYLQDDPTDLGLLPDGEQLSVDGSQANPTRAARGGQWQRSRVILTDAEIDQMDPKRWAQCLRRWTTRRPRTREWRIILSSMLELNDINGCMIRDT